MVRLGLTLPSFREEPAPLLAVAAAADAAGLDGVFAYDHLFRRTADGSRRPALELLTVLGAVAADTRHVVVGSLVARASLRPPAVLAHGFDTVARIAGAARVIAGIGSGDEQSRAENEAFGLGFGSVEDRVANLRDAVATTRDRGYPVWVGGRDPAVREVAAAHADGWNVWGATDVDRFATRAANLRAAAARDPFTVSWGGLVVLGADERDARAKADRLSPGADVLIGGPERVADAFRDYADGGADWVIAGPIDSSDPDNAHILAEAVSPLLRA
ncbi:MAG TPA: LLM class flavin-dependent oxidoreductase [Acidimicrobiia bacterium]|jgi:alkanesulfonate monooxygenase SsuD/methylene tetrahydromethanopterin reductase-like flavin-dependent oxidoreductase (luciferase family)